MTKEEIKDIVREIVKEELHRHILMWHLGIID